MMMETKYAGRIVQVVEYDVDIGNAVKTFEKAMRAPGVRLLIQDTQKRILLNKEFRYELNCVDWRLPGGKVFDRLEDYMNTVQAGDDMQLHVEEAVVREAKEEVGIVVKSQTLVAKKICGATMEWDLWYVLVDAFERAEDGRDHEEGERIDGYAWFTKDQILTLIGDGKIQEGRSAGMLAEFILGE